MNRKKNPTRLAICGQVFRMFWKGFILNTKLAQEKMSVNVDMLTAVAMLVLVGFAAI